MPWEKRRLSLRPEGPREPARFVSSRTDRGAERCPRPHQEELERLASRNRDPQRRANGLAAFQAAPVVNLSTQGIGLRPQKPWASFSPGPLGRTRPKDTGSLGQAPLLPKISHRTAELEAEIHIGSLIGSQPQELFSRSNSPTLRFQACLLLCVHLCWLLCGRHRRGLDITVQPAERLVSSPRASYASSSYSLAPRGSSSRSATRLKTRASSSQPDKTTCVAEDQELA
jgi:hypothetical protein